jgi:hypothetical protein
MWNEPSQEQLSKIPRLYETEEIPLKDKLIHLHFFIGGCDWYIAETDGEELFWGYVILNNDFQMAEWGYISFAELKSLKMNDAFEVDNDLHWKVRPAFQIEKICRGNGWISPGQLKLITPISKAVN